MPRSFHSISFFTWKIKFSSMSQVCYTFVYFSLSRRSSKTERPFFCLTDVNSIRLIFMLTSSSFPQSTARRPSHLNFFLLFQATYLSS